MKIGLLSSDFKETNKYENIEILKYIKEYFKDYTIFNLSQIEIYMLDKAVEVFYIEKNKKINFNTYDVIFIRKTRGFSEQLVDIIQSISNIKNPPLILDEANSFSRPTSKINSLLKRHTHFKQPQTQIILNPQKKIMDTLLEFPVVVKPTHGRGGLGVQICNNIQDIEKARLRYISDDVQQQEFLGYGILIQKCIEFEEEYRINIINGKSVGSVVKKNDLKIKNANLGAKFILKHNKKVIKIAEKVAELHQLFFAGVDIVRKGNSYYVIECNRNPSFKAFDKATNGYLAETLIQEIHKKTLEYQSNSFSVNRNNNSLPSNNKTCFKKKSNKRRKGMKII